MTKACLILGIASICAWGCGGSDTPPYPAGSDEDASADDAVVADHDLPTETGDGPWDGPIDAADAGSDGASDAANDSHPVECLTDPFDRDSLCQRVATAECTYRQRCDAASVECLNAVRAECEFMVDNLYLPLLNRGEVAFHADAFAACEGLYLTRCPVKGLDDTACTEMFTPCKVAGDSCTRASYTLSIYMGMLPHLGSTCQQGESCVGATAHSPCGVCTARAGQGGDCSNNLCQDGLVCVGIRCETQVDEGQPCPEPQMCKPGLACVDDALGDPICTRTELPTGAVCTDQDTCYARYPREARCVESRCQDVPVDGEPCSFGVCDGGAVCKEGTCQPPTMVGEAGICSDAQGLRCGEADLVCVPKHEGICTRQRDVYVGESCDDYVDLCPAHAYCDVDSHICVARADEGEPCWVVPCDMGDCLSNMGGHCSTGPQPYGVTCSTSTYCPLPDSMSNPVDVCTQLTCQPFGEACHNGLCAPGKKCNYLASPAQCVGEHEHPEFTALGDCH